MSVLVMRPEAPVPGTWREIDVVVSRDLADQRRGAEALACGCRRRLGLRQARCCAAQEPAPQAAAQLRELPARSANDGDDGVDGDGLTFRAP